MTERNYEVYSKLNNEDINKSGFAKILKKIGIGGLMIGGGFLSIAFFILRFVYIACVGLSTLGWAIMLFKDGSIIGGLAVLFIATPLAIGLASYFFIFFLILTILSLIILVVIHIFGFSASFADVWDSIWIIIKLAILGIMAFVGVSSFIQAVKSKNLKYFFKENWFYIPFFFLLLWWFLPSFLFLLRRE
ncbi:MAG: hypothetical protein PHO48_01455 [Candidatus Gracilibacteria bacterium]|nr:hypothetical protein [Candidatus Gracilibacteria bacterium]MDD5178982.1 hypothetical protein [Candidatus Gracilibacteria bacterium]